MFRSIATAAAIAALCCPFQEAALAASPSPSAMQGHMAGHAMKGHTMMKGHSMMKGHTAMKGGAMHGDAMKPAPTKSP
jgi:hypothetical protein